MNILTIKPDYIGEKPVNVEEVSTSWYYLHGELEEKFGYDLFSSINAKELGLTTTYYANVEGLDDRYKPTVYQPSDDTFTFECLCIDGEIPVKVIGTDKPCIGFFWTVDHKKVVVNGEAHDSCYSRGLVCFADDKKACKDARMKMKERRQYL